MERIYSIPIQQVFKQNTRNLIIVLLMSFLFACSQTHYLTPSGIVVAWDKLGDLTDRSLSQVDARKNEIKLQIRLSGYEFHAGETIGVDAVLTNMTNKDFIVRRMDAMPVMGSEFISVNGIKFILISQDTKIELEKSNALTGFVEEGIPPPEAFSLISANDLYTVDFILSDIFKNIPVGKYSLQLAYTNDYFGAQSQFGSKIRFIDFDAWIGSTLSNTEFFQVTP